MQLFFVVIDRHFYHSEKIVFLQPYPFPSFPEQLGILLHKSPQEVPEKERARLVLKGKIADQSNDGCTKHIDDKVPHGVHQPGFLHVQPQKAVHGKLKDFPRHAERQRKSEREKRNEPRCHEEIDPPFFIQHIHQNKAEHPQQGCRRGMQHNVPPPELRVVRMDFAEKKGGEQQDDRQHFKLHRQENIVASPQKRRQERQQQDAYREESREPFLAEQKEDAYGGENQLQEIGD